ncbi:hypothetical protein V8G54_012919 [Vigna mungo]|uniref:Uncharacterized protein n=1 Tax=Vigna mungo TaxID=3915 RepID=A0AAQ3NVV0_VIGMU
MAAHANQRRIAAQEIRNMGLTNMGLATAGTVNQPVNLDALRKRTAAAAGTMFVGVGQTLSVLDYENDTPGDNLAFGMALYDATMATTHLGAAGSVLSILRQLWRNLRLCINRVTGIRLIRVKVPSDVETLDVKKFTAAEMLVFSGYFMILLFRNVSNNKYDNFFNERIAEMKALVGIPKNQELLPVFPWERADAVKTILGANTSFCRSVIECLIEETKVGDQTGKLADYVLDKISWAGMTSYRWIFECLMLTNSPV